jgi:hypothetical protein
MSLTAAEALALARRHGQVRNDHGEDPDAPVWVAWEHTTQVRRALVEACPILRENRLLLEVETDGTSVLVRTHPSVDETVRQFAAGALLLDDRLRAAGRSAMPERASTQLLGGGLGTPDLIGGSLEEALARHVTGGSGNPHLFAAAREVQGTGLLGESVSDAAAQTLGVLLDTRPWARHGHGLAVADQVYVWTQLSGVLAASPGLLAAARSLSGAQSPSGAVSGRVHAAGRSRGRERGAADQAGTVRR